MHPPLGIKLVVAWNVLMILVFLANMTYLGYTYFTFDGLSEFDSVGRGGEYQRLAREAADRIEADFRRSMAAYMLVVLAVGVLYSTAYGLCGWGLWRLKRWAFWGEVMISGLSVLFIAGYFVLNGFSILEFFRMLVNAGIVAYLYSHRRIISRV
jgi:hypothetical protein